MQSAMHNAQTRDAMRTAVRKRTTLHKHTTRWSWRSIDSLRTEGGGGGGAGRANNQWSFPIAVILIQHLSCLSCQIADGQDSLGDACAYKWSVAQDKHCECQMWYCPVTCDCESFHSCNSTGMNFNGTPLQDLDAVRPALFWNRSIRQMAMPDLEPCRSNTKRQKLGSNGSSVLDPGSSSNGNRKIPRVRLDRVWNLFRCCWLWPGSSPHAVMASSNAISVRWAGHWAMVLLGPAGTCGQWNTKHSQSGGLIHFTLWRK